MADEVAEWFAMAEEDLSAAAHNLQGGYHKTACFLAHQAAEKSLKALWLSGSEDLWRTHDRVALAEALKAPDPLIDLGEMLNPHYIASRYPTGVTTSYREEHAIEAHEAAEEVVSWVRAQL